MCSTNDNNTKETTFSDYTFSLESPSNCSDVQHLGESETSNNHLPYYTPELLTLKEEIRWGFMLHSYLYGGMFFFLAFYAFFSILNLRSQLSTRPYMSTINSFLCLLGVCRSGVLFIDPYGLQKTLPTLLASLLWELGYPCLLSSFSLIQIAFLQLTQQLDLGPERLRKKTCLSIIITIHFVSVISAAIYTNINADFIIVKLVMQLIFTIWGLFLFGSFLYAGMKVLGVLGGSGSSSNEGSSLTSHNDKGVANLFGMGLLGPGQNLASSLTAALAPTLLQSSGSSTTASSSTPKIKITDENDRTVSVASDSSRINDTDGDGASQPLVRPSTPVAGPSSSRDPCEVDAEIEQCFNSTPSGSANYTRPPSPVLPRRKSSGSGASRGNEFNPRSRLGLNRKDSGPGSDSSNEKEIRKKSLTWVEPEKDGGDKTESEKSAFEKRRASRKSFDGGSSLNPSTTESDRASIRAEALLTGGGGPDYTLQSILSHIAYVNQTALDYRLSRKLSRKNQVHRVIKYTSLTAVLGVSLCVMELIRILSPYGIFASTTTPPGPWLWFTLQSCCRLVEIIMGATVANITKLGSPGSRPPHYAYSMRHKHHRESLYL